MKRKIRSQVKSRFYYYFWALATIAVVSGQMYVGSSYGSMSRSLDSILAYMLDREIQRDAYRSGL
jgi:hypothetical protein|tara:strand:+ start:617 stop:811 length:195 start_codon:yes stop_codon:yes gene_type:complete